MTSKTFTILAFLSQRFTSQVLGFSAGAPFSACNTMMPEHGYVPITLDKPPFAISIGKQQIHYTDELEVTIQSIVPGETFTGFMIYGTLREHPLESPRIIPWVVGTFRPSPDYKLMECSGYSLNTATHFNSSQKSYVNLTWVPPLPIKKLRRMCVSFQATFVKNMEECWVKVPSEFVAVWVKKRNVDPNRIINFKLPISATLETHERKPNKTINYFNVTDSMIESAISSAYSSFDAENVEDDVEISKATKSRSSLESSFDSDF